jgi:hypothetical protein
MKLTDLEAQFIRYTPRPPTAEERAINPKWPADHILDCFQIEGIGINDAHGLLFICPKSRAENKDHYIQLYFRGSPVPDRLGCNKDGKTQRWDRSGTGIADLSLTPSIQEQCDCAWHGHVTLGDAK